MSFMRWQLRRGVLEPVHSGRPGSPWWRAVNERLLHDGCEAVALSGGLSGPASSRTVGYWMSFAVRATARAWYRAHNSSVVAAYLTIVAWPRRRTRHLMIVLREYEDFGTYNRRCK